MFKAQIAIQYSACTIGLVSAMPGSLNTDKIVEAITQVRPFGVDVWSRVRTNGQLDERKIVNLNV